MDAVGGPGAASYVAAQLAFISATKLTTAANAIFLQYAAPIYIVLLGWWLLGERPKRADLVALPVIFCGLVLFLGDDLTASGLAGNILALASGVAMAAWFLAMRGQKAGAPANTILLGNIVGAVIGLPFFLHADLTPQSLAVIVYLGVCQLGMAGLLYSIAIKHVPVLESTIILMLEPILNPIWCTWRSARRRGRRRCWARPSCWVQRCGALHTARARPSRKLSSIDMVSRLASGSPDGPNCGCARPSRRGSRASWRRRRRPE